MTTLTVTARGQVTFRKDVLQSEPCFRTTSSKAVR
jgi:hypothetical protein